MKHKSHIHKTFRPVYGANTDKCTIDVLDYAHLSGAARTSRTNPAEGETLTIVAAVHRNRAKTKSSVKVLEKMVFVFWLESYESAVEDYLSSLAEQPEEADFAHGHSSDKTSKTILKGEFWALHHHKPVISANWKKKVDAPTPFNKLFLVTLTTSYMAYIWRFNDLQDCFEICIQIPLQNVNYDLNFQCLWMNLETLFTEYNFSSRAFLIFYNTTAPKYYSIVTSDATSEDGDPAFLNVNLKRENLSEEDYLSNYLDHMNLDRPAQPELGAEAALGEEAEGSAPGAEGDGILFRGYDDYVQYFEIYAVDGLYNYHLVVTSEYLLGSNEIAMPVKIKSIETVVIAHHTFETGLVTLYTSQSLRPNKITTKFPIVVSKWITLKSTNLNSVYSSRASERDRTPSNATGRSSRDDQERLDEMIGMQISKGLNKIIPPIKFSLLNENDITMNLLLSPYDLFLKDEHIKESVDNVVGLVIRYMFNSSTPLYLKINNELVHIENYFINKIKRSKKVKNVKVFTDKDETLYIIHSYNGTMSALTIKKHDPNDITYHKIHNLQFVSTFQVVEYHHHLYFIVFSPHNEASTQEERYYNCGFYKWENYRLNLRGSWLFAAPRKQTCDPNSSNRDVQLEEDEVDGAILHFKKWYDSNYFCLLSKLHLVSQCPVTGGGPGESSERPDAGDGDVVYLYMIKRSKIVKWLEINNRYYYDLLTDNMYYLLGHPGPKEYEIGDLSILIKNRHCKPGYLSDAESVSTDAESELLYELPLFMGCNFKNKMYPIYHPECVLVMFKLGLNSLAGKLINMMVAIFRKILAHLKNDVYCINANPYDEPQPERPVGAEDAGLEDDGTGGCNCIIFKTLVLKLFCKFNRFFYDYIVKNMYTTVSNVPQHGFSPVSNLHLDDVDVDEAKRNNILYDYVVDDEYNEYINEYYNPKHDGQVLVNELVVYLQVIRLIGLTWCEQYQLINILIKYASTGDSMLLFDQEQDLDDLVEAVDRSNENSDDEGEESCKLCSNSKILLKIAMDQGSQKMAPDNNVLGHLITYMTTLSASTSYYNSYAANKNVTDLDTLFLNKYKQHLNDSYTGHKKVFIGAVTEDAEDVDYSVVWLLLVKNDHSLLLELTDYHATLAEGAAPSDANSALDYMNYLDVVKVGYWLKDAAAFKVLFEKVESYFKLRVKSYKNIEDFDHFGFYLVLQGKVNIFSLLLKTKGFEKFANFLTNDFTQERWKDASVKNAFALISQRRYLLSSAMLILAGRTQDAIDVIYQYLSNVSLCIFVAKILKFDLMYVFKKIRNRKLQYILMHTHELDASELDQLFYSPTNNEPTHGESRDGSSIRECAEDEDDLGRHVELLCNEEEYEGAQRVQEQPYREGTILELLVGTVDELILNISVGIVLKRLGLAQVEQMIRTSSRYYLDKMPAISALMHSLLNNYNIWDKILIYASNFLHFQKFSNVNQKYDAFDDSNQGLNDAYCNNYYYADDYKYLDGNVLVEFTNFTFRQSGRKCPILRTLSSIIPSRKNSKQVKYSYHNTSIVTLSSAQSQYGAHGLETQDPGDYVASEDLFLAPDEPDLIVNVSTLSVVEILLKIKSTLNMDLTLTYYKINSNIAIRNYDLDIESIYTLLVNTFIGFLDSNLSLEKLNIPSLLMNLIHKLTLLTIYSSNLGCSNEADQETVDHELGQSVKMDSMNRLDVGLYHSDLKLVKEEIVCICFVVSLSCLLVLMVYKVDNLPQVYNGLYTQLSLLNQMKGNEEWLVQFLESVINTIEPSLFTNNVYTITKFSILTRSVETASARGRGGEDGEEDLHEFVGTILTLSVLETILGLMRNYIYKQTNYYHYFWLDRLSVSISRYLFNYKGKLIKLALRSSRMLYRLNSLYLNGEEGGREAMVNTTRYSDHEDIVNNFLMTRYNNSVCKLWTYLKCNFKLYSLYSNSRNINPYNVPDAGQGGKDGYFDDSYDYNELYKVLDKYKIINYDNLLIPLIMPLKLIFYKLYYYSKHQLYLNNLSNTPQDARDAKSKSKDEEAETNKLIKRIIDNLRKIRFISLHNAKGRTMSTFYSMPNITLNEHLNHFSLQLILEPIKSDLYMLTELNTNLSIYQLRNNVVNGVVSKVVEYNNAPLDKGAQAARDDNWIILFKFLKYLNSYSNVLTEELFNIKPSNLKIAEKLQLHLKSKDMSNSGGIAQHPLWPIYAIAHGTSTDRAAPSYTVSLQHTQVLSGEFKFAKNHMLLNNIIDTATMSAMHLTTFHSNNLYGDLSYIEWSGDSLCLFDKYGWLMIYYAKNLIYSNVGTAPVKSSKQDRDPHPINTVPTICFKTHLASYHMCWLGEYHILTMGYGMMQESIEDDIIYVNLTLKQQGQIKSLDAAAQSEQEGARGSGAPGDPLSPENEPDLRCIGREKVSRNVLNGFAENSVPCICLWNLVEYSSNNIPKIKVLFTFDPTGITGAAAAAREVPREEMVRVTSVLAIKNDAIKNTSKEVGLEYDVLLFDSQGVMRLFSACDLNIVYACRLETSQIVASFHLLNGNFVTVTDEGKIKVFRLLSFHERPLLVFEASATVVEPREVVSQSSFVSTIGEFISQRFARDKPHNSPHQVRIVSVRLYSFRIIAIVYSDEQVSTTQLPNFAVY